MASRKQVGSGLLHQVRTPPSAETKLDAELIRHLIWDLAEINDSLALINHVWADQLGISEPQWLILMAIKDLDKGDGVSGIDISGKLRIHPAFVTTQTKSLEKNKFISRSASAIDARVVLMFLTEKARNRIDELAGLRNLINCKLFANFDEQSLRDIAEKLALLRRNAENAALRLPVEVREI